MEHLVWTIQLAKWRVAAKRDVPVLNLTAASGISAFAPDFDAVMRYKRGELNQDAYSELYTAKMRQSLVQHPDTWATLKDKPQVALACYCRAGQFCHRHLFLKLMKRYLAREGHSVAYQGEMT